MGLLKPTNGKVLVDGDDIHFIRYIDKWHKNITHVPQDIYLKDSSFEKNIAFGIPDKEINMDKVKEEAKRHIYHHLYRHRIKITKIGLAKKG